MRFNCLVASDENGRVAFDGHGENSEYTAKPDMEKDLLKCIDIGSVSKETKRLDSDVKSLYSELKSLQSKMDELPPYPTDNAALEAGIRGTLAPARKLWKRCEDLLKKAKGYPEEPVDLDPSVPSEEPPKFCYGAPLIQNSKVDMDLIYASNTSWGFVCKYCSLEVADYSAIRLGDDNTKIIQQRSLLAASHVSACPSWDNLSSFYKRVACYMEYKEINLGSALSFEKHMQTRHLRFTLITATGTAVKTTDESVGYFLDQCGRDPPESERQPE